MIDLTHLPSVRALRAGDDRLLDAELRILGTRQQAAVVRALADEVERCVRSGRACDAITEQLAYELSRLGCDTLEAAAAIEGGIRLGDAVDDDCDDDAAEIVHVA